jgi:hypothetical protein
VNLLAVAEESQVFLSWDELSTNVADHFEIQRMDGNGSFVKIGTVLSGDQDNYEFVDSWPLQGTNYYRLEIHHHDGTVSHSNIANVKVESVSNPVALIPNPSNGFFALVLRQAVSDDHRAVIRDISGRIVLELKLNTVEQSVDASKLSAGVYQIEVYKGAQLVDAQKLVVRK